MRKLLTQFLSLEATEEFNGKSIRYLFGQKQKTIAMQAFQDAEAFCCGPSSVFVKMGDSALSEWEGYCAFSFMKHNSRLISNLQVFHLFEINSDVPINNKIVIRLSIWNKRGDMSPKSQNETIDQMGCFAKTAIIKGDKAGQVINACKEIGNTISTGISNICRNCLSRENYTLQVVDPYGLSFSLNWGDNVSLSAIETKTDSLCRFLNDIEEKDEDYHIMFCVNEHKGIRLAP